MSQSIVIPDLGDVAQVEIIEVLVTIGDEIMSETPVVVLESDKATMEVPAGVAGSIETLDARIGQAVASGDVIGAVSAETAPNAEPARDDSSESAEPVQDSAGDVWDVVVIGAGPGGYTAAFRAADLGQKVLLIERHERLGGVCLNVGCIPSKALLHTARVIDEAAAIEAHGVVFGTPQIELDKLRAFKESVVDRLTGGLVQLAKQRKVSVLRGTASFSGSHTLTVTTEDGEQAVAFQHAIIATGSRPVRLPGFPYDDPRLINSTGALALEDIPGRMLVIGGGIIGLEMANVYAVLGASVDIVELTPGLLPGFDADLTKVLRKRMDQRLDNIWLGTRVETVEASGEGLKVGFSGDAAPAPQTYGRVLVATGRKPNGDQINAQAAGIDVDERGFIVTDDQLKSSQAHIYAIGDVTKPPMLAHKATHEGKVAAEVIAGEKSRFDARCIPSVVYTDPEAAFVGDTEEQLKAEGRDYTKGQFPLAANGRSLGMGNADGFVKVLFDAADGRCIGGAAVGPNAGELLAEIGLAIEFGADAHDIGLTIHAHPTLSEAVGMAAEAAAGTLTDLYIPKRNR